MVNGSETKTPTAIIAGMTVRSSPSQSIGWAMRCMAVSARLSRPK